MKSHIDKIVLYGKDKTRRIVSFTTGVNIITGDSKTGKSALLEIIDYCLCSSHCSVPKGKITEYTSVYGIFMSINDELYLIARQNPDLGGKMLFNKINHDYSIDELTLSHLDESAFSSVNGVQYQIESALGMTITNIHSAYEQKKKPSLRNMVSYLFQHQNLIASKFALFYRFTNDEKRKEVIDQFPVFAGFVDQHYYTDLIRLEELRQSLRKKKHALSHKSKQADYIQENLVPLVEDYYALIEKTFPETSTTTDILTIANNLPSFDDTDLFEEDSIIQRYHQLHQQIKEKKEQRHTIIQQLESLESADSDGTVYQNRLHELEEIACIASASPHTYVCPICGKDVEELNDIDEQLRSARLWLSQEMHFTSKYTHSYAEDIRKLKAESERLRDEINNLLNQVRTIEKNYITSHQLVTQREKIGYARSKIQLFVDTLSIADNSGLDEEIAAIEAEIARITSLIDGYDIKGMLKKAESFINRNMNILAKSLDFEDEFKPVDLNFTLVDGKYDLYHHQNHRDKIYLYEMGSGANWLSCHIALFLSFLHFFASQQDSPMPLFMFFDQPSQVYFPNGLISEDDIKQSSDIEAVNQIYNTIFDEVERITNETKITAQIIIVDHVSSEILNGNTRFKNAIRCEWRNGKKLI